MLQKRMRLRPGAGVEDVDGAEGVRYFGAHFKASRILKIGFVADLEAFWIENGVEEVDAKGGIFIHDIYLTYEVGKINALIQYVYDCYYRQEGDMYILNSLLLTLHGEHYTLINQRKGWILSQDIDLFDETVFANAILSKHPKSGEIWNYKKWLLRRYPQKYLPQYLGSELAIILRVAVEYPRNYYSWTYRGMLLPLLAHNKKRVELEATLFTYSLQHVSDYSAYAYRSILLNYFPVAQLGIELVWNEWLLYHYPGMESIWKYRMDLYYHCIHRGCFMEGEDGLPEVMEALDWPIPLQYDHLEAMCEYRWPTSVQRELLLMDSFIDDPDVDRYAAHVHWKQRTVAKLMAAISIPVPLKTNEVETQ